MSKGKISFSNIFFADSSIAAFKAFSIFYVEPLSVKSLINAQVAAKVNILTIFSLVGIFCLIFESFPTI